MPTDLIRDGHGYPCVQWSASNITTFVLNAAGLKVAAGPYDAHKAGVIDRIAFNIAALAGNALADFKFETIAVNAPSGSLFGGSAAQSVDFGSLGGTNGKEVTLATPATVLGAEKFFAVIDCTSGAPAVDTVTINNSVQAGFSLHNRPFAYTHNGAAYSAVTAAPMVVPRYSDGEYCRGGIAFDTYTITNTFASNTAGGAGGDERGMGWTAEAAADLAEFVSLMRCSGTSSDFELCAYTNDNATATSDGKVTITAAEFRNTAQFALLTMKLAAVAAEVAGTVSRVTLRPTSTNSVRIMEMAFLNEDQRKAIFGPLFYTYRTDLGAWTNDLNKGCSIMGVRSAITIPTAGGGGGGPSHLRTRPW